MCAIHGFCWPDLAREMPRMLAAAAHRGPDGSGQWGDHRITLGHNLLALTDFPAYSTQPWHHRGRVLVFNGEVYNHLDLRASLAHQFETDSDTETLAAGLAEQGVDFLRRVDGMYALAWYHPESATLTLARDTNGARPLYYGRLDGRLAFSSEVRGLLALGFDRKISREGFKHYYHAGLVAGPLTLFDGISRLVPGEVLRVDLATGAERRFNLNQAPPPYEGDPAAVSDLLRAKLRQAVDMTLPKGRLAGLFLSGGMDSGAILYEACVGLGVRPRTFSTRFAVPHKKCKHNDDADHAEFLAKTYLTKHREIAVDEQTWVDALEPSVLAMEEPRQGKSYPAYHATNKFLKAFGVKVTLTGDGGDEYLMGYKHQGPWPFARRLAGLRVGSRPLPDPALHMTVEEQAGYLDSWLPKAGLTGDPLNDFLYTESLHSLAEDFLIRGDKLGGAFGMEARYPMTCKVFRDFCRSLPGDLKVGKYRESKVWALNNKALLRWAYTGLLPLATTTKPKTGWRAPTDDWVVGIRSRPAAEGPVRAYAREALLAPLVRDLFGVTPDSVEKRYLNNVDFAAPVKKSGKASPAPGLVAQKELFAALMFGAWAEAFDMCPW